MAGFERGVRPIGLWSMSITLSRCSMPSRASCAPGLSLRVVQLLRQPPVERVGDQRALARAGDAGDADERAERESDRHVLAGCSRARPSGRAPCRCLRAASSGVGIDARPLRYCPVIDSGAWAMSSIVPFGDDPTAVLARAGTDVDDPVGGAHRLLVVLDDDQGVADVAQALQGRIRRALSRWCRPMLGSSRM